MIEKVNGDIFEIKCEAIVNPVNTVGFMGKGLALQYKKRYPNNFRYYKEKCVRKNFDVGEILVFEEENKIIINFPTKKSYQHKSKFEYIELGLDRLYVYLLESDIKSIALPYLGCGYGQLDKKVVEALIIEKLDKLVDINIILVDI